MSGVKIPISADLQTGDVNAAIQKLVEQLNRAGQAIAAANRVKFEPVTKASIDDLKRVQVGFESLRKVSTELNRRMKATGQQGAAFFDLDWTKLHPEAGARARQQRRAFEYVTGRGFGDLPPPPAPPAPPPRPSTPPPGAPRPPRPAPAPPGVGTLAAGVLRQGLGGGLRAMGPVGGAVNGGISAGMAGGMGAGLAGLAGGLLALGIGKVVGGVMQKVGQAEQEAIGYDTLKRQLGDVGVGFEGLRQSLRAASGQISVTFEESQKLAGEFAGLSGLSRNALALAREVTVAGGFGRAFGIAPELAVSAFGQMRGVGLTRTTDNSRRFALMIGEAVARSGVFSKADEILQAVTGYGMSQTRNSLTAANLPGYAGMLSGMVSSGVPGMDVTGSSNILARLNSAIANGGAAGDAGQQFLYMALGKRLGLDPIQTRLLEEGGAFGTGSQAFGDNSIYRRFAARFGLARPGAANSNTTNLEMIRRAVEQQYGSNPELMADAFSNLTGLNMSQSMAMLTMRPEQMGGLQRALQAAHVDISKISPTAFSALANIETGNRGKLMKQVASLRARTGNQVLTGAEGAELDSAVSSGDTEKLRDVLLRLSASRDQEKTIGEQTRDSILNLDKTVQTAATALISPINVMRDALVHMAGAGSTRSLRASYLAGERADINDQAKNQIKALDPAVAKRLADLRAKHNGIVLLPEQQQIQRDYEAARAKIIADRDQKLAELEKSNSGINFGPPPGSDDTGPPDDPGSDDDGDDQATPNPPPGPWPRASNTRGMRNNNPTNLEYARGQPGVRGSDGRFGIYATMGEGVRADLRQYLLYQKRDHLLSVRDMVLKAGPRSDNPNIDSYIAAVAKELGVRPDDPIDLTNPGTAEAFINAVSRRENNGSTPDAASVRWGVNRALGMPPIAPTGARAAAVIDQMRARHAQHPTNASDDLFGGLPYGTPYDWAAIQPILKELGLPSGGSLPNGRTLNLQGGMMPLPPGTSAAGGSASTQHLINFGGTFQLQWPNGTAAAAPITTQSRVALPAPSGTGG